MRRRRTTSANSTSPACRRAPAAPRRGAPSLTTVPKLQLPPAVDVADGRAVRLVQGEAGSETSYGDPLEAAMTWQRDGAEWVHLVDLDAAFGRGSNPELLAPGGKALHGPGGVSGGIRGDAPPPAPPAARRR